MKVHPFIEAEEAQGHSVKRCCELLEVSRAAYYQRRTGQPCQRQLSDAALTAKIRQIHAESKGTYGSPRVHKELNKRGEPCGRRRVRRLMRAEGLEGRAKKRWRKTTVADPEFERAKDLIQREFGPCQELDARYVGDITYIATWQGWAYLATVIDLASRRVVGWALADHMRTELVTDALAMALATRKPPPGAVFHSDRGCQYTSSDYHQLARDHGMVAVGRASRRVLGQRGRRVVLRHDQTRADRHPRLADAGRPASGALRLDRRLVQHPPPPQQPGLPQPRRIRSSHPPSRPSGGMSNTTTLSVKAG